MGPCDGTEGSGWGQRTASGSADCESRPKGNLDNQAQHPGKHQLLPTLLEKMAKCSPQLNVLLPFMLRLAFHIVSPIGYVCVASFYRVCGAETGGKLTFLQVLYHCLSWFMQEEELQEQQWHFTSHLVPNNITNVDCTQPPALSRVSPPAPGLSKAWTLHKHTDTLT